MIDPPNKGCIVIPSKSVMFLTIAMPIVLAFFMGTATRNIMMENGAPVNIQNHYDVNDGEKGNVVQQRQQQEVVLGKDGLPVASTNSDGLYAATATTTMTTTTTTSNILPSSTVAEMKDARVVLQDSYRGRDSAYYESVVHPALLVSSMGPRRVAIIGEGSQGAVLKEVLKHETVEKVTVYATNDVAVAMQRQTPSPWNSCDRSNDHDGSSSCLDDERVKIIYRSGLKKFVQERSEKAKAMYEVVFVDVLNPKDKAIFASSSYNDATFMKGLYNSVTKNGLVVTQLGQSPTYSAPAKSILGHMEHTGFQSFHVYDEVRTQTAYPWATVIACKTIECRQDFYLNPSEVETLLHDNLVPSLTTPTTNLLNHYDGPTHQRYLYPNMAFETLFCRQYPKSMACRTLRTFPESVPVMRSTAFDVKISTIGHGGLGLFAKVDIPQGAAIAPEKAIDPVHFTPRMYDLLTMSKFKDLHEEAVEKYAVWYGYEGCTMSDEEYYVESGLASFANHGCRGTYNMGPVKNFESNLDDAEIEEMNESSSDVDALIRARSTQKAGYGYNPVNDRHLTAFCNGEDYALRDIQAGEEMFTNYLPYVKDVEEYKDNVRDIRTMCGVEN